VKKSILDRKFPSGIAASEKYRQTPIVVLENSDPT